MNGKIPLLVFSIILLTSLLILLILRSSPISSITSSAQTPTTLTAVPTFHSIGLYWSPSGASQTNTASIRYRPTGASSWKNGYPLWYDPRGVGGRPPEYRGSLVHLTPNTTYEIELKLGSGTTTTLTSKTWSENFPVNPAKIHPIANSSTTLNVSDSGTAAGYALYAPATGQTATIDVANNNNFNVNVTASYVIIRGLTLKGARQHGIYLNSGVHDVIIENNDISGWGQLASSGWGVDLQSAVFANSSTVARIIVQRNKMHHPRWDTNSWLENGHPLGPQAITLTNSAGHHVFRYNEVYSDDSHFYNDIFGANSNFSFQGFPNRDSDIYANYLERAWDNPIEAEGANMNIRIWGNFIDKSYKPIANNATSIGPLYIFRNVSQDSCYGPCYGSASKTDADARGAFLKAGSRLSNNVYFGDGKVYLFHNTTLQRTLSGYTYPLGVSGGVGSGNGIKTGIYGRNNIWYVHKSADKSIVDDNTDTAYLKKNDHNFDLYNGVVDNSSLHEKNGFKGVPMFDADPANKQYPLVVNSLGHDAGVRLANFNDGFVGTSPDVGAYEAGDAPLEFGVTAYLNAPSSASTPTPSPSSGPSATPTRTPTPTATRTLTPTRTPTPSSTLTPSPSSGPSASPTPPIVPPTGGWTTGEKYQLLVGDVNDDNRITIMDIGAVLTKYTDFSVPVPDGTPEDVNADGAITIEDVALVLLNYTDFSVVGEGP